ncbi:MAG: tRNA 2-selenouridine(34) synthase MnmH [Proteobacteria bacterium]|nr:tRNA 2-selenouridine(34) synthase MnmH [Pseudomonadota bacterium]
MANPKQINEYKDIIDARSPAEYAEDHIPGAINVPAFNNDERAAVGTLYKNDAFTARRVGAALFTANLAKHLNDTFAQQSADWAPLIYCARGGQRSGGMVEILRRIGWQAEQLNGGYKAYRQYIMTALQEKPAQLNWHVIAGKTGCGKTRLLTALQHLGAQVIDLEKLAHHRGSVFGAALTHAQPSQRKFETQLCAALNNMDTTLPVFVEAESRKIGCIHLPAQLLTAIRAATAIQLNVDIEARVRYILNEYQEFCADSQRFFATIDKLKVFTGNARIASWHAQHQSGAWQQLVHELLRDFYDIGYEKSSRANYANATHTDTVTLDPNNESDIVQAAETIYQRAAKISSD